MRFMDVTDETLVHLCFEAEGICEDDSERGFLDVQLIVGNDSLDETIDIELAAGNLAEKYEFRQAAIFKNEDDIRTEVVGGHTIEFYENNVMILRGRPWWIVLPSRLFTQVNSDQEAAQALNWINERCRSGVLRSRDDGSQYHRLRARYRDWPHGADNAALHDAGPTRGSITRDHHHAPKGCD